MPRHIKSPSKVCYTSLFIQTPYKGIQPISVKKHPELRQVLHDSLQPAKKNQNMSEAEAILECLVTTAHNRMAKGDLEEEALLYVRGMLVLLDDPDLPYYRTAARVLKSIPPDIKEHLIKRVLDKP